MNRSDLESMARREGAILRIGFPFWLRAVLMRGVVGITIGRRIWLDPVYLERAAGKAERLLAHELAHVRQVARMGLVPFLFAYVREYFGHRADGHEIDEAYRRISFEVEAREAERTYLE
jgi:hypothetical protein